ncbi:MAG TPA: oxygen-independent coproporphyrinogen III oxidase [Flavitalea sp.]|nr:oxygen-independent coproporphyrinogen III oxidase [Flavitalea sp.]
MNTALLQKYNIPVPRYTSYPTVPAWKGSINILDWKRSVQKRFLDCNAKQGISLYIHLPFCESLCTYCGCNKKITTNHSVEEDYLLAILKEWELYRSLMPEIPVLRELHLGGGTPTFFSPANLERLLQPILGSCAIHPDHEFSFEGHPNNTSITHLQCLFSLGFRRVSYGVQDNDPEVQRIINRIQPLENVKNATMNARKTGYRSVNYDLIYGLPKQTLQSIQRTITEVITLRPDRIAFYSYAHVPWTSRGQRLFDESDLPSVDEKLNLYMSGRKLLMEAGYIDIGMDHFALPGDDLYKAAEAGKLHRNFMGYTTQNSGMLLGLGVSSISDTGESYAQNKKTIHDYYQCIHNGRFAVEKGYFLNKEDHAFKKFILDTSCRHKTSFDVSHLQLLRQFSFPELELLRQDGLVTFNDLGMQVTQKGKNFTRNVCRAFDLHLLRSEQTKSPVFSKAI